jgi:tetratricopeptide (TPR) repeat protein
MIFMASGQGDDDIPVQFGAILMIDALGVSSYDNDRCQQFIKFLQETKKQYEKVKNEEIEMNKEPNPYNFSLPRSNLLQFGDTIIMYWTIDREDTNEYLNLIQFVAQEAQVWIGTGIDFGTLFRGSIAIGDFIVGENTILGSGMFDANDWYNKADWFGVIFTPKSRIFVESVINSLKDSKDESIQKHIQFISQFLTIPYEVPIKKAVTHQKNKNFLTVTWPVSSYTMAYIYTQKTGISPFEIISEQLKRIPSSKVGETKRANGIKYYKWCEKQFFNPISHPFPKAIDWYKHGSNLTKQKRYEDAILSYDNAVKLDPRFVLAWGCMGDNFQRLGRYEDSLKCYDKIIDVYPNDAKAWQNRAFQLIKLFRLEESLQSYDKAVEYNPKYAIAWNNRGQLLENLNRSEEALNSYDNALEIDPKYALAQINKQNLLDKLKNQPV